MTPSLQQEPKPRGRFFVELESVRGIAALLVAGVHCANTPILVGGKADRLISTEHNGAIWEALRFVHQFVVMDTGFPHYIIPIFFVLSGFVLTESLENGPRSAGSAGVRFAIARFFRIYPAVIATVLLFWLAFVFSGIFLNVGGYSFRFLLRNALLLDVGINGVLWTVQSELMAVPLIWSAFLMRGRWRLRWIGLMALAFIVLSFAGWWTEFGPFPPSRTEWLYTFLFGVLAYHLGQKYAKPLNKRSAFRALLVSVFVLFAVGKVIHNEWQMISQTIAAAIVIPVIAFGPKLRLTAPLRTPSIRFLGRVSYSFYLLHPLTLAIVWHKPELFGAWIEKGAPGVVIALALWIATSIAILPLAWLMHVTVEIPGIRLGRRIWRAWSPDLGEHSWHEFP